MPVDSLEVHFGGFANPVLATAPHFFPDFSAYLIAAQRGKAALLRLDQSGPDSLDLAGLADQVVHRFAVAPVLAVSLDFLPEPFGIGLGK